MDVDESIDESIGGRVATWRKLAGLTGRTLAQRAKVSYSLLSKVEAGAVPASPAFTAAVARVLGVDVATLNGQPYRDEAPHRDRIHTAIPQVRREVAVYQLPPDDGDLVAARSVDVLAADVAEASRLRQASRYGRLGAMLPPLLAELRAAFHLTDQPDRRRVAGLLAEAYDAARALAYKLGYPDLAAMLVDRYEWATAQSDDILAVCVGDTMRAAEYIGVGEYRAAQQVMTASRQRLDPIDLDSADPATLSVWGYLHLEEALATARSGDADRTEELHAQAARAALAIGGDRDDYRLAFGPTNVGIWGVGLAVELGDHARALSKAADMHIPAAAPRERASHHYIDLARGWLYHGDRDKTLVCLQTARQLAPQHARYHPMVRETLMALARANRRATGTLSEFAAWVGLEN